VTPLNITQGVRREQKVLEKMSTFKQTVMRVVMRKCVVFAGVVTEYCTGPADVKAVFHMFTKSVCQSGWKYQIPTVANCAAIGIISVLYTPKTALNS
jgi:hypothetical protein